VDCVNQFYDKEVGFEIDETDFLESIEPEQPTINHYREAAERLLPITWSIIGFIRSAKNHCDFKFRSDLMAYIFGSPELSGFSEEVIGLRHGKTRAAVSAAILRFQRANDMMELLVQKQKTSRKKYHETRKGKLNNARNN
jgi:hypothetical protein